jgi:hypothetical protein
MFQVFQMFQTYVSSVSIWMLHMLLWLYPHVSAFVSSVSYVSYLCYKCFIFCKSRSGCCICCYAYTRMFQSHFQVFHLFQTYVANVHLDVLKVNWGVARRGRWLLNSVLPQPPVAAAGAWPWVNPRGFPHAGTGWARRRGSCDGRVMLIGRM